MSQSQWQFDAVHSHLGFSVRHMMISKVRGEFAKWNGSFLFDDAKPESAAVTVDIDAASIDTREPQRDGHLRSPDFFDAAAFPRITFVSTKVERAGGTEFKVTGDLTIRGVTRPVVLEAEYAGAVKDMQGSTRAGFALKTAIDRKDFGLLWNVVLEAGGIAVADKVEINIEIEAVKVMAAAAA